MTNPYEGTVASFGGDVTTVLDTPRTQAPPATLEEARNQPGRREQIEAITRLIESEGIKYVFFQQVSITGRVMGKGVVADFFPQVAEKGYQLVYGATANLFTDRAGNYIGFGPEESELAAIADLSTFAVLPWDPRVARVFCDCYDTETGELLDADPRQNLKRVVAEFEEELGYSFLIGIEPEMMWLKRGEDGSEPEGVTKPYCYHIHQFEELRPVLLDVVEYGQALGLDMSYGDHEDAPGQLELNFRFDRPVKTADNITTYRQICAAVGRKHGLLPTFMPKPFTGVSANGHHHHFTLMDENGNERLPRPGRPGRAVRGRPPLPGRHARPLRRADVRRQPDGQLLLPHVGLRLLGAGLQELGLAEPHLHRARGDRRALRVSRRRLVLQPLPERRRAAGGGARRDPQEERPGPAPGRQHLRPAAGRQRRGRAGARARQPRRRADRAGEGRGAARRHDAGPALEGLPSLQARRVGELPGGRHGLGARPVPGGAPLTMCGIAGIIYREGGGEHQVGRDMTSMLQAMKHRGPDSTGYALYRPESEGYVMHVKLSEENGHHDFDLAERLNRQRADIEGRMKASGATISSIDATTSQHAMTVSFGFDGDLKDLADYVEDVRDTEVLSLGRSLEIIKDLGDANTVAADYKLDGFLGTHAIGHARMATESDVDIANAHPYWAYPFPDVAVVHNGQLTNYHQWRRRLERAGHRFQSECDSEIIAVYLAERMAQGDSLEDSMRRSLGELDGVFTYLCVTEDALGVAKDELGAKPLVLYESDDIVALASEEIAIRKVVDREIETYDPYEGAVMVWTT